MSIEPGALLDDHYRLEHLLGRGGMAEVYLGRDVRTGQACAVKVYRVDHHQDAAALADAQARCMAEAEALREIDHPGVPRILDQLVENGSPCIVMEHVEGETLFQRLKRNGGPLPEASVAGWACQVLDALEALHGHRPHPIIHRDIKPSNIVITPDDRAKLIDLGITLRGDGGRPGARQPSTGLATIPYAPPEQIRPGNGGVDPRSDLFALGATLYQALTDRLPIDAIRRAADPSAWVAPGSDNPLLSAEMEAVILRAMALDVDARFQSAAEMRAAIEACASPAQHPLPAVGIGPAPGGAASPVPVAATGPSAAPPPTQPVPPGPAATPRPWDPPARAGAGAGLPGPWDAPARASRAGGAPIAVKPPTSKRAMTRLSATRPPADSVPETERSRSAPRQPSSAAIAGLMVVGVVLIALAGRLRADVGGTATVRQVAGTSRVVPLERPAIEAIDAVSGDASGAMAVDTAPIATASIGAVSPSAPAGDRIGAAADCPLPSTGRIAFASDRTGNWDIFVMLADGDDQRQITTSPGDDRFPALSPDGRRVAFASARGATASDIYVVGADGAGEIRVTVHPAEDRFAAWSPDGRRLAFDSLREGLRAIYWIDADAGETTVNRPTRWSPAGSYAGHPSWSVRGQLAFNADPDADADVFVMAEDGSPPHRVTTSADADWSPSWSPDGSHIVYATRGAGRAGIAAVDNAGGLAKVLLDTAGYDWAPSWSPDGAFIAFTSDVTGRNQIYTVRTDGSCMRQLTYDGAAESPSWSW